MSTAANYMYYGNNALELKPQEEFVVYEGGRRYVPRPSGRIPEDLFAPADRPQVSFIQKLATVVVGLAIAAAAVSMSFYLDSLRTQELSSAWNATELEEVIVHTGDTLWDIASAHPVDGLTTEQTINFIQSENELTGGIINPGQHLLVPSH